MPRQARLDYPGAYHHVMGRGIDGLNIFKEKSDKKDFLSRIKTLQKESSMQIHAWCLMDNHYHLLYHTGQTEMATFMRQLLTGYAVKYNKRHRRRGHLFQNRYKSIVVEADEYFLPLVRYIHLNPVKAKIVSLTKLNEYPWCGHQEIIHGGEGVVINREEVLSFFGSKMKKALVAYNDYLKEGMGKDEDYLLGGGLIRSMGGWQEVVQRRIDEREACDERVLGGGDFVTNVLQRCEQDEGVQKGFKDGDDLIVKIENFYGIPSGVLIEEKTKEVREARSVFLFMAVKYLGMSVKEAGRVLKIRDSAASSGARRGMIIEREKEIFKRLVRV